MQDDEGMQSGGGMHNGGGTQRSDDGQDSGDGTRPGRSGRMGRRRGAGVHDLGGALRQWSGRWWVACRGRALVGSAEAATRNFSFVTLESATAIWVSTSR